ncbi:MAG: arylsulfatase [Prevotellaceae bacterium]|nr:arylsulfatase [Prevotellaceae bacterium]
MKKLLATSICALPALMAMADEKKAPNVILLVADDLGYGDLSCYGADRVLTPNVDNLAAQGVRFTNAHAVAATSTPSRYSLLTGEYAWRRNGTDIARGDAGMIIRPECYTLADMFKSEGYTTAAVGKWHLGLGDKGAEQDWNAPLPMALGDIGFDYSYIMAATADRVPCVFIENGRVANYDPSAPIEVSYMTNFDGEPTGKDNPELLYNLKPSPNHGHDQSIVNGISRIGYMKGGGKALWKDENIADSIAAKAVAFIEKNRKNPFFMYLCTNDVHVPRFPHERFRGKNPMGLRGEAIMQFDWTVGQILKALKRLKLTDNTLIILTSDNGPVLDDGYMDRAVELVGSHTPAGPFRGGKYSAFEGGTAVPFIVCWPGHTPKGKVSDALVSHIDDFVSLGSLLGATLPKGTAPDSRNFLATWLGQEDTSRPFVVEQAADHTLSIFDGEWKYITPSNGSKVAWLTGIETGYLPAPQLYNLKTDNGERKNQAEAYPDEVRRLQGLLNKVKEKD